MQGEERYLLDFHFIIYSIVEVDIAINSINFTIASFADFSRMIGYFDLSCFLLYN